MNLLILINNIEKIKINKAYKKNKIQKISFFNIVIIRTLKPATADPGNCSGCFGIADH